MYVTGHSLARSAAPFQRPWRLLHRDGRLLPDLRLIPHRASTLTRGFIMHEASCTACMCTQPPYFTQRIMRMVTVLDTIINHVYARTRDARTLAPGSHAHALWASSVSIPSALRGCNEKRRRVGMHLKRIMHLQSGSSKVNSACSSSVLSVGARCWATFVSNSILVGLGVDSTD